MTVDCESLPIVIAQKRILGPEVIKPNFMLNSAEHEICPANKSEIANSFLLNIDEQENVSANKYENATIVGIFIFICRYNFMLS